MSTFLTIVRYLVVAVLAIFELSETAYYFDKKKWGLVRHQYISGNLLDGLDYSS